MSRVEPVQWRAILVIRYLFFATQMSLELMSGRPIQNCSVQKVMSVSSLACRVRHCGEAPNQAPKFVQHRTSAEYQW